MFYPHSWSHPKPNMQNPFISVTCVLSAGLLCHTQTAFLQIFPQINYFSPLCLFKYAKPIHIGHMCTLGCSFVSHRECFQRVSHTIYEHSQMDGYHSERVNFILSKYSATDILHKSVCYLLAFQTNCLFAIYVAIYIFCCHTVNMMKQLLKYILQNILLIYGYIIPKSTFNCSSSCSKLFRSLQ